MVLGGVHGDEYEGIVAVRAVFRSLDPTALAGTFLGVPVCNPPAFSAGRRESPVDGKNLARVFPGRPDGTVSDQIAHALNVTVIRHADFLVDLHSSGTHIAMPLLVGYDQTDDATGHLSREAARRFGVATVWGHPRISPGRSMSDAHLRRVPWLYTESPSGGWLHRETVDVYARGVLNVMGFLRMIPGEASPVAIRHELSGDGDVDRSLVAPASGFLVPRFDLLDRVSEGDCLGVIEDLTGDEVARLRAPVDGTVVLVRKTALVQAGDLVFRLRDEVAPEKHE